MIEAIEHLHPNLNFQHTKIFWFIFFVLFFVLEYLWTLCSNTVYHTVIHMQEKNTAHNSHVVQLPIISILCWLNLSWGDFLQNPLLETIGPLLNTIALLLLTRGKDGRSISRMMFLWTLRSRRLWRITFRSKLLIF